MTEEEAVRVAELVDALASARAALESCVRAMREMPGRGGMPALMANGTANRITLLLDRAEQERFLVEIGDADDAGN